ncbi:MAG: twin-arginine translocation signal domain-containing protein [Mesorhizobium sp.]|uniref:ABC transporter substrate-binding protein n=1 Tax=Mesorhizobium sp. TaxID=1871066 RepID=UPI000FE90B5F|nr:ABC transporter substrate-binding protein [Mesorhizobium sp.]RWM03650.1 MAG: twin-arginine translocation signal domain-containing protein [Mesorhizobium sp.]TIO49223.1 MAG: twin-arginine translocation signal domain-containing protein [Mesorhizobium sp.]TIO57391.1 MAG: twin-arginine translocation signal domain-containing protein [Mesorhizobium sp.]TJV59982.1 MAG: twin-arginine translocation signal domain-containing protein [Mesorhizobium sp.]
MSKELEYLSRRVASGKLSRRDFLGRAAALGVAAPFANSLLSSAARAAGPVKGGTLKAGMVGGASTDSLDPALDASQVPFAFGKVWGETLVELAPGGGVEYLIAEEIGASDDAKTWTMKIRKGVQFHNGKEVTPDDVVATLKRHSDEKSKSGALGVLKGIDTIKTDGGNVVVTLKDPNADLPYLMADYHLIIQPNGGMDKPDAGIGTGPYKVAINKPGVKYGGERFANYWQPDKYGHADQVEIIIINDATARTAALQGGQVNMINRVEPKIVDLVKRLPGVTIRAASGRGFYPFNMFCDTAPFDNNDLRMALKLAMDREEMLTKILRGYGSVGNDMPVNKAYPLFTEIEQRKFDPEKAAALYKKSGHSGSILLRTSDVAFPGAVDAAQLYQQSCAKAGIKIEIKREPGDGYWTEVWNKQPFSLSYWGGRPTQDQMYSTAYLSTADWNDTHFKRPDFDKMVLAARGELDEAKRKKIYRDMGEMMRDEGGLIVPFFNQFVDATGKGVEGWVDNPAQELSNGHALIQCWLQA